MSNEEKKRYDEGFKRHIVELHEKGQSLAMVGKAYGLHPTTVSNWVKYSKNSGSFKAKDNLNAEQRLIKEQEVLIKQQQMELDILKKAIVVMLKT